MEAIKQDMPPPGGFSSINYKRIPLKQAWPSPVKWVLTFGFMGFGWCLYKLDKDRIFYETIEKRSALFSIFPLLMAENDRLRLRHFIKLRDQEAEVMKDVKGWKVGTYFGEPIYKTLKPDEWYEPNTLESWIYTDMKGLDYAMYLKLSH